MVRAGQERLDDMLIWLSIWRCASASVLLTRNCRGVSRWRDDCGTSKPECVVNGPEMRGRTALRETAAGQDRGEFQWAPPGMCSHVN